MKKTFIAIMTLSLVSCASIYRRPESIQDKMSRYRSKEIRTNIVPDYFAKDFSFRGRIPASAEDSLDYTNKNLYFLSLYKQYEHFSELYPSFKKNVKYCPRFHQELLTYREANKSTTFVKKEKITENHDFLNVVSKGHSNVEEGIKKHMNRNFDEIIQLCEQGYSHNYYIYENLVTLSKEPGVILRNKESYNILLKNPIFFNQKLLTTIGSERRIQSRGIASTTLDQDFIKEASHRVGAKWFSYYLKR